MEISIAKVENKAKTLVTHKLIWLKQLLKELKF